MVNFMFRSIMYLSRVSSENVIRAQRGPAKFRSYLRRRSLYAMCSWATHQNGTVKKQQGVTARLEFVARPERACRLATPPIRQVGCSPSLARGCATTPLPPSRGSEPPARLRDGAQRGTPPVWWLHERSGGLASEVRTGAGVRVRASEKTRVGVRVRVGMSEKLRQGGETESKRAVHAHGEE